MEKTCDWGEVIESGTVLLMTEIDEVLLGHVGGGGGPAQDPDG